MMKAPVKILYVSSEITPFVPETSCALVGQRMPQAAQEAKYEIRAFMPKYGCINERRNQLHEVIRLSGFNVAVGDKDHAITIKVAALPKTKAQVYFIDNEEYFKKKLLYRDEKNLFLTDNDERAILFAKGVLETVKKLRWQPAILHCNGWISHLVPLYLRSVFGKDPIYTDCKIIVSLYDEVNKERFTNNFVKKVIVPGIKASDVELLNSPSGINLAKLAVKFADGVIIGSKNVSKEVTEFAAKQKVPVLAYADISANNTAYTEKYLKFYGKFVKE